MILWHYRKFQIYIISVFEPLHLLLTGQKRKNPNQVFAKIPSFFTQPKDMHIKLICDSIMPSGVSVVGWMSLCASLGQLG